MTVSGRERRGGGRGGGRDGIKRECVLCVYVVCVCASFVYVSVASVCAFHAHKQYTAFIASVCLSHAGTRGGGLGSRPKKMYWEYLGDGVEYHLMKPTPRR